MLMHDTCTIVHHFGELYLKRPRELRGRQARHPAALSWNRRTIIQTVKVTMMKAKMTMMKAMMMMMKAMMTMMKAMMMMFLL